MQEQEEEQQHLESQLSTIKNYDAEAKQRMAELREQELAIERSEVLIDVYLIASQNLCHIRILCISRWHTIKYIIYPT